MDRTQNIFLLAAAALDALAALLHLGCIVFGASWYRFFGAGERVARLAEAGSARPAIVTVCIAAVLTLWAAYALAGAGLLQGLPLLRPALWAITVVFLLRGAAGFGFIARPMGRTPAFWAWSSAICLLFGCVHLLGLWQMHERSQ